MVDCTNVASGIFLLVKTIFRLGFFRRDKEACHECRFCCTLSICTTPLGSYFIESSQIFDHQDTQQVNARSGYQVDRKMWKDHDFRCLKPKKNIGPEKWPHHEMIDFREAKTKKELQMVKEVRFDKYFFNLEDPEVWKDMTDLKKASNIWKKTYGYDFAALVEGLKGSANMTKCMIDCFKSEQRSFARKCKRKGGLFKCCLLR